MSSEGSPSEVPAGIFSPESARYEDPLLEMARHDSGEHIPRQRRGTVLSAVFHQAGVSEAHDRVCESGKDQVTLGWFESRLNKAFDAVSPLSRGACSFQLSEDAPGAS